MQRSLFVATVTALIVICGHQAEAQPDCDTSPKGRVTIERLIPRFEAPKRLEARLKVQNNTDRPLSEIHFQCVCGNGRKGFARFGGGVMRDLKPNAIGDADVGCDDVPKGPKPEIGCITPLITECPAINRPTTE